METNSDPRNKIKEDAIKKVCTCAADYIDNNSGYNCPFQNYQNPFQSCNELTEEEKAEVLPIIKKSECLLYFEYFCKQYPMETHWPCPQDSLPCSFLYDGVTCPIKDLKNSKTADQLSV